MNTFLDTQTSEWKFFNGNEWVKVDLKPVMCAVNYLDLALGFLHKTPCRESHIEQIAALIVDVLNKGAGEEVQKSSAKRLLAQDVLVERLHHD